MGMASHLDSDPPIDGNRDLWLQQDAHMFLQIINSIELRSQLCVCKTFHRGEQQDRSLTTYAMEFKKVYEEMNSLLPLSTDVKAMQTQREQIAVISFLSGLRPEFDSLISQFLNESAIPLFKRHSLGSLEMRTFSLLNLPIIMQPWSVEVDIEVAFEEDLAEVIEEALEEVTMIGQQIHEALTLILVTLSVTTAMSWVIQNSTDLQTRRIIGRGRESMAYIYLNNVFFFHTQPIHCLCDVTFHENLPFFPVSPSYSQRDTDDDLLLYTVPSSESSALPDPPEESRPPTSPPEDTGPPTPPSEEIRPPSVQVPTPPFEETRPPIVQSVKALAHPGWRDAMLDELKALEHNVTWDLVELPIGKQAIGLHSYMVIYWRKFTWSNLPGFVAQGECGKVCKLRKSLYGLKQYPRACSYDLKRETKADDGDPLENLEKYRRVMGRLNYLTITRPDIAFPNHGHHAIEGFTDADYDGDPTSRRSTTGYCVFVGGNLVSWRSKKQNVVSRSSAESECRAMEQTTCELIWLRNLLGEIGFSQSKPMHLWFAVICSCFDVSAIKVGAIYEPMMRACFHSGIFSSFFIGLRKET
ncbi:hypothetical protein OSB04_018941 [Centaurea solstitialis]|uniref:Mitochondrial protein n=1 Tax=Centaurea solstitialis TaxID=347529 RepID=A0AA38T8U8_9ASTR|nr:hypothetical protein OSB04_018941 [Centaurea solstitialis]